MSEKMMTDYRILPLNGGGVCAVGVVNGVEIQTTRIVQVKNCQVKTKSGSLYSLSVPRTGMWGMQLGLKRPQEFSTLQKNGLVG